MTEVEYKTQYIRKRLTRDNNLICDIYFEYPELICGKKELCDINSFYRQFVDNAIIFARDKSNEGEKNALRMYFSAERLCDRSIGITLFTSLSLYVPMIFSIKFKIKTSLSLFIIYHITIIITSER